jgi:hypothetical protein
MMKGFNFPYDGFKKGLRPHPTNPRNSEYCTELYNLAPAELGLEGHEEIQDITIAGIDWKGQGQYTPTAITRTITVRVTDYVDDTELATVSVYLDSVLMGTTDVNGELSIADVLVGGRVLKLVKTGYVDSDDDTLYNDYIFVI